MNHDMGSGWRSWLPMIACCVAMLAIIVFIGLGFGSLF